MFLLSLVFLVTRVRRRRSPSSTFAWFLVILLVPGVRAYRFTYLSSRKMRRMARWLVILLLPNVGVPLYVVLGRRRFGGDGATQGTYLQGRALSVQSRLFRASRSQQSARSAPAIR